MSSHPLPHPLMNFSGFRCLGGGGGHSPLQVVFFSLAYSYSPITPNSLSIHLLLSQGTPNSLLHPALACGIALSGFRKFKDFWQIPGAYTFPAPGCHSAQRHTGTQAQAYMHTHIHTGKHAHTHIHTDTQAYMHLKTQAVSNLARGFLR